MSSNYDSSQVGVPYLRVNSMTVSYPENGVPSVIIQQAKAVKLADGRTVEIEDVQCLSFTLDMIGSSMAAIPLINPTTGAPLGPNTNLQNVMLGILAVIRQQQLLLNP
jgi:hypothetical protein